MVPKLVFIIKKKNIANDLIYRGTATIVTKQKKCGDSPETRKMSLKTTLLPVKTLP